MDTQKLVPKILELCIAHARSCLRTETAMSVDDINRNDDFVERISLRDITAVIAVGGPMSFLVAFSLDVTVLDKMFRNYTSGLEISEDEVDEYRHETLGDIINLVLGRVTTDLRVAGAVLTVSPPIVFADSRQIRRPKRALFSAASLITPNGILQISVIGPPELFDRHLNVVE